MYYTPVRKQKIEYKTVGDADQWIQEHCTMWCPIWNTNMKPGVCEERRQIASADKKFVSDITTFSTINKCLECKGAVPITEKEHIMKEKVAIPEVGTTVTCQRCGELFEAYKNGSVTAWKTCRQCMTKIKMERQLERSGVNLATLALSNQVVVDESDSDELDTVTIESVEKKFQEHSERLEELRQREIDIQTQQSVEDSFMPIPIADPGHPLWEVLFKRDKTLFKDLKFLAVSERRDFHSQILHLLETHPDMLKAEKRLDMILTRRYSRNRRR